MDPITQQAVLATAGAAGGDPLYVDDVFSTFLYDGTGTAQTITNGIDLAGEGGLVWLKQRDVRTRDHALSNTVSGSTKRLASNLNSAESTSSSFITSFNNNGFSIGTSSNINQSGAKFASWSFRKAPGFFDVVTYTGTGSNRTVAHSLGSVPGMIIIKATNDTRHWWCYHRGIGNTGAIALSLTGATTNALAYWNNTSPTSSVFTVGTDADVNASGTNYVAYIFAHDDASFGTDSDESIIKCGSYTGNATGDFDEQFIDTGFEPQWVLVKKTSGVADWNLTDRMRSRKGLLYPSSLNIEDKSDYRIKQFRSTGFDVGASSDWNANGQSYIYMAIRRPHKPPTAGTDVYMPSHNQLDTSVAATPSNFPVDLLWSMGKEANRANIAMSRLTGEGWMMLNVSNSESDYGNDNFEYNNNVMGPSIYGASSVYHMFKRAPGFMDVVCYDATGSTQSINHNLEVAPELVIVKKRIGANPARNWIVGPYISGWSGNKYLFLNTNTAGGGSGSLSTMFPSTPTATTFTVGSHTYTNQNNCKFLAYLFATLSGISKVGSYSGTGNAINVDCGFTAGARFILIRRTDSTGDWYSWNSSSGIVSGNDPFVLLNDAAAESTVTDYVDPLNSGFTVTSSAPAGINASGGTYIFLAIA